MKKSKRFLAILLALSMTAALAACTPDETDDTSTDPPANQQTDEATLPTGETEGTDTSESGIQTGESGQDDSGTESAPAPQPQEKPSEEKAIAPKATNDPTKMSKAELVNYYNTAANDAKKNAKSITKTQNQASKVSISANAILQPIASGLMSMFLSEKPKKVNETYSSTAEKNANFYVAGKTYSSQLTAGDVTSASCAKSGSNYIVTLKVKGSSVHKAFSTITKNQILDAVDGKVEFNKIDVIYSDSTIQATIGSNGKLQKVYYDMPRVTMDLNVAMFGGIEASLSIHLGDWFTINW